MKYQFSPYIAIPVKDNEKAVDFYKRVLGMEFKSARGNDTYLNKDGINFVFENNPGSNVKRSWASGLTPDPPVGGYRICAPTAGASNRAVVQISPEVVD
jgi:catechol 2,3-dioxygenase-like lactoylglutathione lyase family enzyme